MLSSSTLTKALIILLLGHLLGCMASCCDTPVCKYSELVSMDTVLFDNSGPQPAEITQDTIPALGFMLRVVYHGTETQSNCQRFFHDGLRALSNPCYAFKCAMGEYSSPDSLIDLQILSSESFDAEHPAGTDLMDLFVAPDEVLYTPDEFYEAYWPASKEVDYFLFKKPDAIVQQQFIVMAFFKNGEVRSDTTQTIALR